MPPPRLVAELPASVQALSVRVPSLSIPPPKLARLPVRVIFVSPSVP